MAALDHDLLLKLDPDDHAALLAARIAARDADIVARNEARKQARAEAKGATVDAQKAATAKAAALATMATQTDALAARVAAVKVKHEATDLVAQNEGHDLVQGAWAMFHKPKLEGFGPIIDRRLPVPDAQCDEWVASYRVLARTNDEASDLQRQIEEYRQAHPALFAGTVPGGEPPPVDPVYEALKAALTAKQDVIKTEQAKQAAICAAVYAVSGVKPGDYSYWNEIDPATGEIVLGRNPYLTLGDKVIG